MRVESTMSQACFNCWFNKEGACEFNLQKEKILSDASKTREEKDRLVSELNDKAVMQGCPNITPSQV